MKTQSELVNICKRKTKDTSAESEIGFKEDLDIALGIVDSILNTNEDTKTGTLDLSSGTETYNLATDVETIEQILITSTGQERELGIISKDDFRRRNPVTANDSPSVPSVAYFSEPTINPTTNVEIKNISFYPIPDGSYTATYSYKRALPILAGNSAYPSFNGRYHHILADYAIWQYAERETDESMNPIYWQNKWQADLEWIIETYPRDTKFAQAIQSPDQLEAD